MLDRTNHEIAMRNILDAIYSHKELSSLLGFKGGTACYFFYGLPRFSTDLDFNLLDLSKKELVFELLKPLLSKYSEVRDSRIKRSTIFFLLSHTSGKNSIKVEVSAREAEKVNSYELVEFYGTSILVMKREDIFAGKLIALKNRHTATSRDLYDVNFFLKNNWGINEAIIEKVAGCSLTAYLEDLPGFIESSFNKKNVHLGLGGLLESPSERDFVKNKLIEDTINRIKFLINLKQR